MRVETHNRLRAPDSRPATRVVVYDDFNNPIAVLIQVSPNNVYMSFKGQKGFEEALRNLGIVDTTVVTVVEHLPDLPVPR